MKTIKNSNFLLNNAQRSFYYTLLGTALLISYYFILSCFYFSFIFLNIFTYLVIPSFLGYSLIMHSFKYKQIWQKTIHILIFTTSTLFLLIYSVITLIDLHRNSLTVIQHMKVDNHPYEVRVYEGEVFSAPQITIEQRIEVFPNLYLYKVIFSKGGVTLIDKVTLKDDELSFVYAKWWNKENRVEKHINLK